jgi:hypothetical protein
MKLTLTLERLLRHFSGTDEDEVIVFPVQVRQLVGALAPTNN